jgi:hypothetical protein
VWFYPCSYICNYLKMPKKSQIDEYSDNTIMKQMLRLFAIHQSATSLQHTNNLNPRTKWYPDLDKPNWMKSAYFIILPSKNSPPQMVVVWNPYFFNFLILNVLSTGFTSSIFPIQLDFSQNQPAAITLNTGSPRTLTSSQSPKAVAILNACFLIEAMDSWRKFGSDGNGNPNYGQEAIDFFS